MPRRAGGTIPAANPCAPETRRGFSLVGPHTEQGATGEPRGPGRETEVQRTPVPPKLQKEVGVGERSRQSPRNRGLAIARTNPLSKRGTSSAQQPPARASPRAFQELCWGPVGASLTDEPGKAAGDPRAFQKGSRSPSAGVGLGFRPPSSDSAVSPELALREPETLPRAKAAPAVRNDRALDQHQTNSDKTTPLALELRRTFGPPDPSLTWPHGGTVCPEGPRASSLSTRLF